MCRALVWIIGFYLFSQCNASFLRGKLPHVEEIIDWRRFQSTNNETFDCTFMELDGLSPPDQVHIEPKMVCVLENSETSEEKTLFFDGNVLERFGDDLTQNLGNTRMTIPNEALHGSTIDSSHTGITMNVEKKRRLATTMGIHNVLIVRVIGTDYSPISWKPQLYNDFFTDENNLVSFESPYYL